MRLSCSTVSLVLLGGLLAGCVDASSDDLVADPGPAIAARAPEQPRTPGHLSVVFHEERIIDAAPEAIWDVLTDLPSYAAWNPWIVSARGDLVPGGDVEVQVVLGGAPQQASHVVLTVVPDAELCWRDGGWNAWFVYGQRCRWIEPLADGTVRYTNELLIDGVLSWLVKLSNGAALTAGMQAENAALAAQVE